jgi:hypothetical protein
MGTPFVELKNERLIDARCMMQDAGSRTNPKSETNPNDHNSKQEPEHEQFI